MEERELELPGLPQACDITPVSWSNLYSADQMRAYGAECARQAVLAERNRSADKCAEQAKRWRDDRAVYVAFECAAAIRKG